MGIDEDLTQLSTRRQFVQGAVVLAGTAALAGCGAATTSSGSKKIGGTLRYIGFQGEDEPSDVASFLKANKINLQSTYISENQEVITKIRAGGPGRYDVMAQFDRYFKPMLDLDMIEPLNLDLIPNIKKLYPRFQQVPWAMRDGKVYGVPAWFGFETFNYRPDLVKPAPTSFAILADPRYHGKVAERSDATDNVLSIGEQLFGFGVDGSKYTKAQLKTVMAFFKKVKKNTKVFATSFGELKDLMVRGDVWIGNPGWEYIDVQAREQGVSVSHFIKPTGPLPAWTEAFAIVKGSQNVATAHAWINAMISTEAMAKSGTALGTFPCNSEAPAHMSPTLVNTMGYPQLNANLARAVWGTLPPVTQSNPMYTTLEDWNSEWEGIWG